MADNVFDYLIKIRTETDIESVIKQTQAQIRALAQTATQEAAAGRSPAESQVPAQLSEVTRTAQRVLDVLGGDFTRIQRVLTRQLKDNPAVAAAFTAQGQNIEDVTKYGRRRTPSDYPDVYAAGRAIDISENKQIAAKIQQRLAEDEKYIKAEAEVSAGLQAQRAAINKLLAADTPLGRGFARSGADNQIYQAQQRAQQAALTAQDPAKRLAKANADLATSRAQLAADEQQALAKSSEYRKAVAARTIATAQQTAREQQDLAKSSEYRDANIRTAVARAQQNAREQTGLAGSDQFRQAQVQTARAMARQAARVEEDLSKSDQYRNDQVRLAKARSLQAAREQESLAGSDTYRDSEVRLARARSLQAARVQEGLASGDAYTESEQRVARARAVQASKLQAALAGDDKYIEATVALAGARAARTAKEQAALAADTVYLENQASIAASKEQQRAIIEKEKLEDGRYVEAQAQVARYKQQQAARYQRLLAEDEKYAEATAQAAFLRREAAAKATIAEAGIVAPGYVRRRADALGAADTDLTGEQAIARAAVLKRTIANVQSAQALAFTTQADIRSSVESRAAEAKMRAAISQRERAYIQSAIKAKDESVTAGTTRFQRLQASFSSSAGRLPSEFQTLPQFVGQKVTNTIGYGIGGLITGGLIAGVVDLVKTTSEFEQTLVRLQGQLQSLGVGNQFGNVRDQIKAISVETGVAANDVATFARRMVGVFGDPARALRETESAMKLVAVSGLDLNTLMQSLVPAAKNFGISIEEVGDIAVAVSEKYGLAEDATISFLGKSSAAAKEAGLSINDMAIIGANMANSLGKDLDASADVFNKLPSLIQANQERIYQVYRQRPETAQFVDPLIEQITSGNEGQAFKTIISSFNQLSSAQRGQIITSLASRREAEELISIMENSAKITRELGEEQSGAASNSGKLEARFRDMQGTLTNVGDRIRQAFEGLGETLFSSGLGEVFVQIGNAIGNLLSLLGLLVSAFKALNDVTKVGPFAETGVLVTIAEYAAIAALLAKALGAVTGAKAADTAVTGELAAADTGLAGAQAKTTVTTEAETVAIGANSAAKSQNILSSEAQAAINAANATQAAPTGLLGRFAGNSAIQRLFGGGTLIKSGTINAAAAANGITGASLGSTALSLPGLAITAAGALAVKSSYDENQSGLKKAQDDLRSKMEKANASQLEAVANTQMDFWDNFQSRFFGVDMPQQLAAGELRKRSTEKSRVTLKALTDSGQVGNFAQQINDQNLRNIQDFLNATPDAKGLAQELGLQKTLSPDFDKNLPSKSGQELTPYYGLDREQLKAILPKIREGAEQNKDGYAQLANYIDDVINTQTSLQGIRDEVSKAKGESDLKAAIDKAGGVTQYINLTFGESQQQYELGQITSAQYISKIDENISLLNRELGGLSGQDREQKLAEMTRWTKQRNDLADKLVKERIDQATRISSIFSSNPAADKLQLTLAALPQTSLQGQLDAVPDLIDQVKSAWEEKLDNIADPLARAQARINTPIEIPDELRSLMLQKDIGSNLGLSNSIREMAEVVNPENPDSAGLTKQLSDEIISTNQTVAQVLLKWVDEQIARLKSTIIGKGETGTVFALNQLFGIRRELEAQAAEVTAPGATIDPNGGSNKDRRNAILEELNRAKATLALRKSQVAGNPIAVAQAGVEEALLDFTTQQKLMAQGLGDPNELARSEANLNDARRTLQGRNDDLARRRARWAEIFAKGDPVATTAAQVAQAQLDLSIALRDGNEDAAEEARQRIFELQQTQQDNGRDIDNARRGALAALVSRDPLKSAQAALAQAQADFANAKSDVERWNAFTAAINAQFQIDDAISAIFESRANLAIALANAAGRPVEAARLAAAEAKRKLDEAIAQNRGENEINQLRGNFATANAAALKSSRDEQLSIIDFQLQMGQITTQQAISMMQAQLATIDQNTEEYRSLALRIQSLMKGAEADAQFNLPSNLTLPTLYEARRVNQSNQAGIGYQDNRQIALAFTINGATDANAVAGQIMAAFQSAAGGGALYAPQTVGVGVNP